MNITNWFTAVVEDICDPLQLGRVRVRCFTYHSPSQNDIPTEDLPWATCILPVTSAATSGIGQSATGLLQGSWVFGFFRDGAELQDPVILGSLPSSSSSLPGEGGNGFADPHGTFPNLLGPDIPGGATTYGYGSSEGLASHATEFSNFNTAAVGQGTSATSFSGPTTPMQVNGSMASVIAVARREIGVVATTKNQGPGIAKYWAATSYTTGYDNREHWCAAFACWCIQQGGIFSEADRPKTPAAFRGGGFEAWARSKAPKAQLTMHPTRIAAGDLVIFSISHIGIATTASDLNGVFSSVEGNTFSRDKSKRGFGVWEKTRKISELRSSITITQ